ncbi:hypothetical protein TNCV_1264271 [Trichonephila clavipes]|nr:hypothetical protein TNCV_1264271 [Trichonephila clavipes]
METIKAVMEGIFRRKEREFEEQRLTREYEMERLSRLSNATETVSLSSADLEKGKGFQLTPVALSDRFESHQRRPGIL